MKSDTIETLKTVVHLAGERGAEGVNPEDVAEHLEKLLERVAEVAGDCLEEHTKARDRLKPRKARVDREVVQQIAAYFCDPCDTVEGAQNAEEGIREILVSYDYETVDYTGRTVKIS